VEEKSQPRSPQITDVQAALAVGQELLQEEQRFHSALERTKDKAPTLSLRGKEGKATPAPAAVSSSFPLAPSLPPSTSDSTLTLPAQSTAPVAEYGPKAYLINYDNGSVQVPHVVIVAYSETEAMERFREKFYNASVLSGPFAIPTAQSLWLQFLFREALQMRKRTFDQDEILKAMPRQHHSKVRPLFPSSAGSRVIGDTSMRLFLFDGHSAAHPVNCQSVCVAPSEQAARYILAYCLKSQGVRVKEARKWGVREVDVDQEDTLGKIHTFQVVPNRLANLLARKIVPLHPRDSREHHQSTKFTTPIQVPGARLMYRGVF